MADILSRGRWVDLHSKWINVPVGDMSMFNSILTPNIIKHIEAETRRPPFCRRHFQMRFLERKCINVNNYSTVVCSQAPINNISALVQITARRCPRNKPLSEPMMAYLPTHICITRPQWFNLSVPKCWLALNNRNYQSKIYCREVISFPFGVEHNKNNAWKSVESRCHYIWKENTTYPFCFCIVVVKIGTAYFTYTFCIMS